MPPDEPEDPDCDFCRIVAGRMAARVVLRVDDAVAFFPDFPAVVGHTLLVPRAHLRDIWELGPDTAASLARWTLVLAEALRSALDPEGLSVVQSSGGAASQTVEHLHVHLVPRWRGDALPRLWPPKADWPEERIGSAHEAIRAALRRQPA